MEAFSPMGNHVVLSRVGFLLKRTAGGLFLLYVGNSISARTEKNVSLLLQGTRFRADSFSFLCSLFNAVCSAVDDL